MFKFLLTLLACSMMFLPTTGFAQQVDYLTIDSCYVWAKRHYPLTKQFALLEASKDYSLENANKGYLPQLSVQGQATYQSDVTQIPFSAPNASVDPLSQDQYRLYGEAVQPLTDLFFIKDHKALIKATTRVESQKLEVELYKLHERINQLYFGVLLMDAQIQQTLLVVDDIQNGIKKLQTAVQNGTAIDSDVNQLEAELLKTQQRTIELKSVRSSYLHMLSHFIGKTVDEKTIIIKPEPKYIQQEINRPEVELFSNQKSVIDYQTKLLRTKNIPKLSLFVQSGVGRPALNMLSNDFESYYIGGVKLNWNLNNMYTNKNERKLLHLNKKGIDYQRETFLFNTQLSLSQHQADLYKYSELIKSDRDIFLLREQIKQATQNKLENGTVTANDYLKAVSDQDQAHLNQILHQIQLLMTQYAYQTTSGN